MRLPINLLRASSARASSSLSLDVWLFDGRRPKIRILGGGSGIAGDGLDVRVVGIIGEPVATGEAGDVGADADGAGGASGAGAGDADVGAGDVGTADDSGRGADRWLPASF